MIKIALLLCLLWQFPTVQAGRTPVTIGCTEECGYYYKIGLQFAALFNNVKLEILDLSKQPSIDWDGLDGILIPGGADINPEYYLSSVESDLVEYTKKIDHLIDYTIEGKRRDPFEYDLLKEYFSNERYKDIPILGVCRGMQMLAVSQGIPLYVDIHHELGIKNRRKLHDRVIIEKESSQMSRMFKFPIWVYKNHHQGIRVSYYQKFKDRWPQLKLTSFSHRKQIAESMEFSNRPVLGVQFHPERDFAYERSAIFGWLVSRAKLKELGHN